MPFSTIAILFPGQMGASFAQSIRAVNPSIRLITAVAGRSQRTQDLARTSGFEDVGSYRAVLEQADVVLSVVVPDKAKELALDVAKEAQALSKDTVRTRFFVDLNAVSPGTVKEAAAAFDNLSIHVVDGGIFGGPATSTSTPPISLSGPKDTVEELHAFLNPLFLSNIRIIGGETSAVGQASALKLTFASLTKGLTGLAVSAALLAEEHGISEALQTQLQRSPLILKALQERVPEATAKVGFLLISPRSPLLTLSRTQAFRWVGEMEEISTAYADAGLPFAAQTFSGLAATQEFISKSKLGEEAIEENLEAVKKGRKIEDVVKILRESRGK